MHYDYASGLALPVQATKAELRDAIDRAIRSAESHVPELLKLLHAADCFPRGGLYNGYYSVAAALRYERYWTQVMASGDRDVVPPLDVAFAWFIHRQDPGAYGATMYGNPCLTPAGHPPLVHPSERQAFGFGASNPDRHAWAKAAGHHPAWPPPAPGSGWDVALEAKAAAPRFAAHLATCMGRLTWQLRTWLRPHFLDAGFLDQARIRYVRFLQLHIDHPRALLVPAADIALIWHTHMGLSASYEQTCLALFGGGPGARPWRPAYLELSPGAMLRAYAKTAALYGAKYGASYDNSYTGWMPHVPYVLAEPGSPLAFALQGLDENPRAAQQRAAIDAAAAAIGLPFPRLDGDGDASAPSTSAGARCRVLCAAGVGVGSAARQRASCEIEIDADLDLDPGEGPSSSEPSSVVGDEAGRAGAHALYLTWLAAWRAEEAHGHGHGLLHGHGHGHSRLGNGTAASQAGCMLAQAASALVSVTYFVDLPAYSEHPYLALIERRTGPHQLLLRPPGPLPPLQYDPADPRLLLGGTKRLAGLATLLRGPPQAPNLGPTSGPGPGPGLDQAKAAHAANGSRAAGEAGAGGRGEETRSPLWRLLAEGGGAQDPDGAAAGLQRLYGEAWAWASERGVDEMLEQYQSCHASHFGFQYFESDYYVAQKLHFAHGEAGHPQDFPTMAQTQPRRFGRAHRTEAEHPAQLKPHTRAASASAAAAAAAASAAAALHHGLMRLLPSGRGVDKGA